MVQAALAVQGIALLGLPLLCEELCLNLLEVVREPHLPAFYAQVPGVRLLLHSGAEVRDLHQRQADIALRLVRPEAPDLVVRRLHAVRFGFYADSAYLRRTARADWRFLTLAAHISAQARWAHAQIGSGEVALACNDFELIKQGARAGLGIGFLPADSVQANDGLQPVALRGTQAQTHEETLYLVMHEDVRRSPKVRAVADFLVRVLAEGEAA